MKKYILIICLSAFPVFAFSQYDYSYGKWDTTLSSMPFGRFVSSALTYNDSIYILGGALPNGSASEYIASVDVYDPASDTWIAGVTEIPYPMCCPNACLIDSKIYVLGGLRLTNDAPIVIDSVFIYDIQSHTWERGQSIPASMTILTVDTIGGKIYMAGGTTDGWSIVNDVYVYDPELDEWTAKAPMNATRRAACARSWNDKLYVFGGYSGSSWTVVKSIEVYDPESDQWTLLTNAYTPRAVMTMSLLENQLFIFAGIHGYSADYYYTDFISRYDLASDSWLDFHSEGDKIPGQRQFPVSAVVNDKFYLLGGMIDDIAQKNVWAYSLKNIRQDRAIRDTVFVSESIEIDLGQYFSSGEDEELHFSVCPGYNEEIISASIENSILEINKLAEAGESIDIAVNAFNSEDTITSNTFSLDFPVGIQNYTKNQVSVYPNPASNRVIIHYVMEDAGMGTLKIYNSTGQEIAEFNPEKTLAEGCRLELNVEDYCNGLYFAVLKTNSTTLVSKLLILH